MKSIKLILLSTLMFVIPAVAMDQQPKARDFEATRNAMTDLFNAIENCHKNDGEHGSRMNAFRDSSYKLSADQCKPILELHSERAKRKFQQSECNDCKEIDLFIRAGIDTLSKEIEAGRGDMSVMALAIEAKKRNEQ